jgi:hypothetical protein
VEGESAASLRSLHRSARRARLGLNLHTLNQFMQAGGR